MKIKGISVFELHIEKVVFALFFLALLGIFGAQFFIPSKVKVGSQEVAPAAAGKIAADKAQRKVSELESQSVHADVPDSVADLRGLYERAAGPGPTPVSILAFGSPQLNIEGGSAATTDDLPIDLPEGAQYAAFDPPSPSRPLAMTMGGTLDPRFVDDQQRAEPGFKRRLGLTAQPFDVRGISLETTIDSERLVAGLASIHKLWWDGRVELLDVEVLRQELLPDGSWSEAHPIAKSPGQRSLADAAQDPGFSPADLRKLLDEENDLREEIRNPRIMPTIAGEQWVPPTLAQERESEYAEITPEERQIERLMGRLESLRRDIARLRDQMDKDTSARGAGAQPVYYAQGGRGGGGGRDGGRGGGGDSGGGLDTEAAERERQQKIRENQQKRLDTLLSREADLVTQIEELGGNPNGAPQVEPIDPADFIQPTDSLTAGLSNELKLWAHDFDAEPGKTYRYAVRYWATNPFFGKGGNLSDEQKSLADGVAVASVPSEWSDPVGFAPDVQYFVASARQPQRGQFGASASAEFEVFQFYYGYWRRGMVRVGAGEPIQATIDVPEGLVIYELDEDNPEAEPTEVPIDPATIRKAVDAYLMDVLAGVAGQGGSAALVATSEGDVHTRYPDLDTTSPARERLASSSELGIAAGPASLDPNARPAQSPRDNPQNTGRGAPSGPGGPGGPGSGGRDDRR